MKDGRAESRRKALKKFMEERDLKVSPWAIRAGVSEGAVRNFLKGLSKSLRQDVVEKLAAAERVSPGALFGEDNRPPKVKVLNYIGAGAEVLPIDDYARGGGMYEVDAPDETEPDDLVGLEVKGDSMRPIMPGWVVMYRRHNDGVTPECLGKLCIVRLDDERTFVKVLRPGYIPGTYNLESWASDLIPSVKVTWASPISWIRPK